MWRVSDYGRTCNLFPYNNLRWNGPSRKLILIMQYATVVYLVTESTCHLLWFGSRNVPEIAFN